MRLSYNYRENKAKQTNQSVNNASLLSAGGIKSLPAVPAFQCMKENKNEFKYFSNLQQSIRKDDVKYTLENRNKSTSNSSDVSLQKIIQKAPQKTNKKSGKRFTEKKRERENLNQKGCLKVKKNIIYKNYMSRLKGEDIDISKLEFLFKKAVGSLSLK